MNRHFLLILAGCYLIMIGLAWADDTPPFANIKQYSAEMISTAPNMTIITKMYVDDGKARSETTISGMKGVPGLPNMPDMQTIGIVRPDQKKIYMVMPSQRTIMEMPWDDAKAKAMAQSYTAGKFDSAGSDTINGVACTKYKTTIANQVFFMWMDTAKKLPVKVATEDGSMIISFTKFKEGPQDPALFEPPTGYQVVPMPSIPGMPGSPAAPAAADNSTNASPGATPSATPGTSPSATPSPVPSATPRIPSVDPSASPTADPGPNPSPTGSPTKTN
jgi:hypothetical protein